MSTSQRGSGPSQNGQRDRIKNLMSSRLVAAHLTAIPSNVRHQARHGRGGAPACGALAFRGGGGMKRARLHQRGAMTALSAFSLPEPALLVFSEHSATRRREARRPLACRWPVGQLGGTGASGARRATVRDDPGPVATGLYVRKFSGKTEDEGQNPSRTAGQHESPGNS